MSLSILALRTRDNKLETVVLELLGKAKCFYNDEINVILPVGNSDYSRLIEVLEQAGANKVYIIKNEKLENYATNTYKNALLKAIEIINPEIFLIGATVNGRDLAPQIASALQTGLTADCTELDLNEDGKLAATRPTFGGSLMATILSRKYPQMATVRPNVFKKPVSDFENKAIVEVLEFDLSDVPDDVREFNFVPKTIDNTSISDADVIVAVGKGIGSEENIKLAKELATLLNGKLAASRALVDIGLCESSIQVGQTGKTVAPKIYIACGISGALQHVEGIKGAKTIIAINKDASAPIFKVADYKIIGDISEILPKLIEEAKRN